MSFYVIENKVYVANGVQQSAFVIKTWNRLANLARCECRKIVAAVEEIPFSLRTSPRHSKVLLKLFQSGGSPPDSVRLFLYILNW